MARWFKSTELVVRGNRLLRFYSYYSLFLALLLIITDAIDLQNVIIGGKLPHVFFSQLFCLRHHRVIFCSHRQS
ncbi:MAG: hypothetical protein LRY66_13270 [Saccharospirillaceae bacterium]|nr:hypothetical protein [Saccharospirillaceae bacterium]